MINSSLIEPKSIAVIGASNNLGKPGGGLIKNLLESGFPGEIFPVNPREKIVQGLKCYKSLDKLPEPDLAILAIPAEECVQAVEILALTKNTKVFIIISAGFSETGEAGAILENKLKALIKTHQLTVIGPNCIGILCSNYAAVFISPVPKLSPSGVDFVSASGAFAVFFLEEAQQTGMRFNSIYSVGNSTDIGIEEVLEHWDETFNTNQSSKIKVVYAEEIRFPERFFNAVRNLRTKGCQVLVIKPGSSEAGERAALSHTGSLAGDSLAQKLLIRKAGAHYCENRLEMVYLANILSQKNLEGKNLAIVTHAGGPGVMLADHLEKVGFHLPQLDSKTQDILVEKLHPGSSAQNPIDILATANKEQLEYVIDICDTLEYIDGIIVVYGKTGMEDLFQTYELLGETIQSCSKPVYALLPSVFTAHEELKQFTQLGNVYYSNEHLLANCLGKLAESAQPQGHKIFQPTTHNPDFDSKALQEEDVLERLNKVGIPHIQTLFIRNENEIKDKTFPYPLAAKVTGILHKTEKQGVILNIQNQEALLQAYMQLIKIAEAKGILVQEMADGAELFIGGKLHQGVGYSVHVGLGGILVELVKDISSNLAPVSYEEALYMLSEIRNQKIFDGFRNLAPISREAVARLMVKFSELFSIYPDIVEIDLNPLMAKGNKIIAVDARIMVVSDKYNNA